MAYQISKTTCVGFTTEQWNKHQEWKRILDDVASIQPEALPLKEFKQVYNNLPVLGDYHSILPDEYGEKWISRTYESLVPTKSWICPSKLKLFLLVPWQL